jgi:hypothetical protein
MKPGVLLLAAIALAGCGEASTHAAAPSPPPVEVNARGVTAVLPPGWTRARESLTWFTFADRGRHFHVLVAFGPQASTRVQQEAWTILDGLRIDPGVRPDWRSSG